MISYLMVFMAGGMGCCLRYLLQSQLNGTELASFPLGTAMANLLGCLLSGALIGMAESVPSWARLALVVGVMGGLTTMSGFAMETIQLLRNKQFLLAIQVWVVAAAGSPIMVWLGYLLSSRAG